MSAVKITPLHPSLGAEVAGIDLSKPVDEPMRHTLMRALADHLALVFHDQSLTPAQYLSAASVFVPPMEQHYSQHNMPGFPLIGRISGTRTIRTASVLRRRPFSTGSRSPPPAAARASRTCERRTRACPRTSAGGSSR